MKKNDSNTFFWKKMENAILFTVLAVNPKISQISIFGAKHKHITGKIKLQEYSIVLRVIKIVKMIGNIDNREEFFNFLRKSKAIPVEMEKIIMLIADEWFLRRHILYATPNVQEEFKSGLTTFNIYISKFYSQIKTFK